MTSHTPVPAAGPRPTDAEIDIFGLTHAGSVRPDNQDHFLICQLREQIDVYSTSLPDVTSLSLPDVRSLPSGMVRRAFLMMVADGVGGGRGGEEASRFAVQAITRYVAESIDSYYGSDTGDHKAFARALSDAALRCHADLLRHGGGARESSGMATTLTMFVGVWPWAYLVQLGDSRYYVLRNGELLQVSRDQTLAQELIDQGAISREVGMRTRWSGVLSSALGGSTAKPVVTRIALDRGDVQLLCSDGLTKHVSDEQIGERLRTLTSAEQACRDLLRDAFEDGGSDNVTIIVGRVRPAGS